MVVFYLTLLVIFAKMFLHLKEGEMSKSKEVKKVLDKVSAIWDRMIEKDRKRVIRLSEHKADGFIEFPLSREERKLDTTKY